MSLANHSSAGRWLMTAAISGFVVVAMGAFGAHALTPRLSAKALDWYAKAVSYQQFHTLAVLACAVLLSVRPTLKHASRAAGLFVAGMVFFSGSLYVMALTGQTHAAVLTPIGGIFFLAGWLSLTLAGKHLTTEKGQAQ